MPGFCEGQKKKYGIYHWDTFDNETFRVHEENNLDKAEEYIKKKYSVSSNGADQVHIVTKEGQVVRRFHIT